MRLSEIQGEKAFDVLAELMSPLEDLSKDKTLRNMIGNVSGFELAKYLLKEHKKEVIEVMAILNEKSIEEFEYNVLTLPKMLIEIITDPVLLELFHSLSQNRDVGAFGSASENTEE